MQEQKLIMLPSIATAGPAVEPAKVATAQQSIGCNNIWRSILIYTLEFSRDFPSIFVNTQKNCKQNLQKMGPSNLILILNPLYQQNSFSGVQTKQIQLVNLIIVLVVIMHLNAITIFQKFRQEQMSRILVVCCYLQWCQIVYGVIFESFFENAMI